jgi:uncharacterized protein (DUF1015 family)
LANLKAFKALLPENELADRISARSADFDGMSDLLEELERNPYTFHHLTKAHLESTEQKEAGDEHFEQARKYLRQMEKKGLLHQVSERSFFIYRQINLKNGDQFNGLITLCDASDYENGSIKRHENVQTGRVSYLSRLLKETNVMGEPVLLSHPENRELEDLYRELAHTTQPVLRFISVDRKQHELWQISEPSILDSISQEFKEMKALYIADGHHRSHIASQIWAEKKENWRRFFLALIVPEDQLQITSFHRLWKQKEAFEKERFLEKLSEEFDVIALDAHSYEPGHPRLFGLYLKGQWFELSPKHYIGDGVYDRLDVVLLEQLIFQKIFDVHDSRSDNRLSYFSADQPLTKLMEKVDVNDCQFAITVYPPDFSQIRAIADAGLSMPPKSTFVEPKLRAGMIIQRFSPEE